MNYSYADFKQRKFVDEFKGNSLSTYYVSHLPKVIISILANVYFDDEMQNEPFEDVLKRVNVSVSGYQPTAHEIKWYLAYLYAWCDLRFDGTNKPMTIERFFEAFEERPTFGPFVAQKLKYYTALRYI